MKHEPQIQMRRMRILHPLFYLVAHAIFEVSPLRRKAKLAEKFPKWSIFSRKQSASKLWFNLLLLHFTFEKLYKKFPKSYSTLTNNHFKKFSPWTESVSWRVSSQRVLPYFCYYYCLMFICEKLCRFAAIIPRTLFLPHVLLYGLIWLLLHLIAIGFGENESKINGCNFSVENF